MAAAPRWRFSKIGPLVVVTSTGFALFKNLTPHMEQSRSLPRCSRMTKETNQKNETHNSEATRDARHGGSTSRDMGLFMGLSVVLAILALLGFAATTIN